LHDGEPVEFGGVLAHPGGPGSAPVSAERECSGCGSRALIADSEEYWNEEYRENDEPGAAGRPWGSEEFEATDAIGRIGVALARTDNDDGRRIQ
jgi:hypothetical protein